MANDDFTKSVSDFSNHNIDHRKSLEYEVGQRKLERLKNLHEQVNWEIEEERESFYWQLCRLINDWKSRLPNLRKIFLKRDIDWLLKKCVKTGPTELIKFVIRTKYKDEPDFDAYGEPLLLRNTPVHYAAEHRVRDWVSKVRELFKIYDKFNVNYIGECGFTHFHVACMSGCVDIVKKFLELRQDPNCIVRQARVSALHLALHHERWEVVQLLLKSHADLNLADRHGLTPLHIICRKNRGDVTTAMVESLFECGVVRSEPVLVDARDNRGNTPLHLALKMRHAKVVELLLERGANPNLAKWDNGSTALHIICKRAATDGGDSDELLFDLLKNHWPSLDLDARNRNLGRTPLHFAAVYGKRQMIAKLLRNGADPNLADENGWTVLHWMITREDDCDDDLMEKFFEIAVEVRQTVEVDATNDHGETPLENALTLKRKRYVEVLLRRGADPNFVNPQTGTTPLHVIACSRTSDDLPDKFFETCGKINKSLHIEAMDPGNMTPLYLALYHGNKIMVESLLRNGADPSKASRRLNRPLHFICAGLIDDDLVERFFQICEGLRRIKLEVDVRNVYAQTPLHLALRNGKQNNARDLLGRGANPNATDEGGLTPLHFVALRGIDDDLAEKFFEICNDMQLKVQVNARENRGRGTPLQIAVQRGHRKLTRTLLRSGADPNLADGTASTPLHLICGRDVDDDLLKTFFNEVCYEQFKVVHVDAQDELGRTPLQWAVANLLPNAVDVLLDRGADLSSFVFPTESHFDEMFVVINHKWDKLRLASGILVVVERLEDRGYDLSRSDVLTIIKLFVEYGLFEESSDLEDCWYDEEDFTNKAKEIVVIPNLSLYDLILLPSEKEDKLLSYTNYFEVERLNNLDKIPGQYRDLCLRHLCEKVSRRYFQRMALEAFQALIHYRLPVLCCEKIIENLTNEDLSIIYQAVEIAT